MLVGCALDLGFDGFGLHVMVVVGGLGIEQTSSGFGIVAECIEVIEFVQV